MSRDPAHSNPKSKPTHSVPKRNLETSDSTRGPASAHPGAPPAPPAQPWAGERRRGRPKDPAPRRKQWPRRRWTPRCHLGPPNPRRPVHPNTAPIRGPLPFRGPAGVRAARAGFRLARVSARLPPPRLSRRLSHPYSFLRLQAPSPPSRTETREAERLDAGPESARCASSSRTPPSCRGKGERVRENFIKTPPKGGQAPHCACALAAPLKRADEGRACALWSLLPSLPSSPRLLGGAQADCRLFPNSAPFPSCCTNE